MASDIIDNIYSVGFDDPACERFESQYPLAHGMSYNSYLITDRLTAIIDSVEEKGADVWFANIKSVLADKSPDYIVVQHMEPDHSGSLAKIAAAYPRMKIVASAQALKMLSQFFPEASFADRTIAVKEGDTLDLGEHKLSFYAAPMVHWPEVMVSYESATGTLFSADAFGKFGSLQYDDEWTPEARRYYINIVGRYGSQVQALLRKIRGLEINRIASLHGPVLSAPLNEYLALYDKWSAYEPETEGVLVAYASIYGGTASAALELAEKLRIAGVKGVVTADLTTADVSEVVAQAFRLSHLVIASPTYDSGLFPAAYDFIHHLTLKNYRNRTVGYIENGSWAPTAARRMQALMATMPGISDLEPVVTILSRLNEESRSQLARLAEAVVESLPNKS